MTKEEEERELDEISKKAVDDILKDYPRTELKLWQRLGLILAAILLAGNAVVSIYNSLSLRTQVDCNSKLSAAVNQVGDQSRNITRDVINNALASGTLSAADKAEILKTYNEAFDKNTAIRRAVLSTTCDSGSPSR